jgi:hypothetical protein
MIPVTNHDAHDNALCEQEYTMPETIHNASDNARSQQQGDNARYLQQWHDAIDNL